MGKIPAFLLVCIVANVTVSQAQNRESIVPADVSLAHFAQIDEWVYVGSKPRTDQDFRFLQSRHIRYIVNVRFLPLLSGSEKKKAKQYGMTLLTFPMNASPIQPSQKHVNQILFALHDRQFQPVYIHCVLGRDRSSLISGLYKIYFLGVPKSEARQEMKQSAFHTWWFVRGLTVYFDKHSGGPPTRTGM
jgi:protein-tyrosine phosphatase